MKKIILFLCVGNTCRSPMAEGFAKNLGNLQYKFLSAGCAPGTYVNEKAIKVMQERGIDIKSHTPKKISLKLLESSSIVVSMGEGVAEACPVNLESYSLVKWNVDDPYGKNLDFYRSTRDKIEKMVKKILEN